MYKIITRREIMKKWIKTILITLLIIIIMGLIFFAIDYLRIQNNQKPIFCISFNSMTYSDGGTREYLGMGYKIIDFNKLNGYDEKKIGLWNMKYEDFKDEYEKLDKTNLIIESAFIGENVYINAVDESKEVSNMIMGLTFSNETCDGLNNYIITLDNGETYGLEVYDNICHITSAYDGEAVLTEEQSKILLDIIDKYSLKNVSLDIKDETLTKSGATIVITDLNENPYTYSEWYRIDKLDGGYWKELQKISDATFSDIGIIVGEEHKIEENVNWATIYGELEEGEYRLVKSVYENENKYLVTLFSIK